LESFCFIVLLSKFLISLSNNSILKLSIFLIDKLLMVIYLLLLSVSLGCDRACTKCTLRGNLWLEYLLLRNPCDQTACLSGSKDCYNSCDVCYLNSTQTKPCDSITYSNTLCIPPINICGNPIQSDSSGLISTPDTFPSKTLCRWIIDLTDTISYDSSKSVKVSVFYKNNVRVI
jgi:hypothetical protein